MEPKNTEPENNERIARKKTWFWVGGVGAVLAVALIAYGLQQNAANNTPPLPPPSGLSVQQATSGDGASATVSAASFKDAAKTWSEIEEARGELDSAVEARSPEKIHDNADKIRDLLGSLSDKSAALPPDKRQALEAEVKHAEETAKMLRNAAASSDTAMLHEHHQAMHNALASIRGLYPAQALRHERHGEHAAMSGRESAHADMSDNGKAGMSKPGGAMPNAMMEDDMTGGNGKMAGGDMDSNMDDMMDKMMSGMGANDKQAMETMMPQMKAMMSEMKPADRKEMMEEMMAMPPAGRAKAMQKKMKEHPGMGMGGGMSGAGASGKKTPDKSAPPKSGSGGGMSGGGMGDGHM